MQLEEGLNFAFSVPIAYVRWSQAQEISSAVSRLLAQKGLAPVPGNPVKLESVPIPPSTASGALGDLFAFVESLCVQIAAKVSGVDLDESMARIRESKRVSFLDREGEQHVPSMTANVMRIEHAWLSGYDCGHFHSPHSHPNAAFAAVYCVSMPKSLVPQEGALAFLDPRRDALGHASAKFALEGIDLIHPMSPGDLLVFPGWLTHYVFPHTRNDRRITVAMNINVVQCHKGKETTQ